VQYEGGHPINAAKRKMLAGKPALGTGSGWASARAAEDLSFSGLDFVLCDLQHGEWTDATVAEGFRAINHGPATPMARVGRNDFGAIGRLLDRGALGIIIPLVNTVEDARAAAYAARFPPHGGRSWGGGPSHYGPRYERWVDDELFLAVQIESITAVENAEAILSVPGVDGCWVGPADLAKSMDIDRETPEGARQQTAAILRVIEACRKTGKIAGISAGLDVSFWLRSGMQFVTMGADSVFMLEGARRAFELAGQGR